MESMLSITSYSLEMTRFRFCPDHTCQIFSFDFEIHLIISHTITLAPSGLVWRPGREKETVVSAHQHGQVLQPLGDWETVCSGETKQILKI